MVAFRVILLFVLCFVHNHLGKGINAPRNQTECKRQDHAVCRGYYDTDWYCTFPWMKENCAFHCRLCDIIPDCGNIPRKDPEDCSRYSDPNEKDYYCDETWWVKKNCYDLCGFCKEDKEGVNNSTKLEMNS